MGVRQCCTRAASYATLAPAGVSRTWLDRRFDAFEDYRDLPATAKLSGQLPVGWIDESSWCDSTVRYSPISDAGTSFLRASGTGRGKVQMSYHLPHTLACTTAWRVKLRARGSACPLVGFRQQAQPHESDTFMAGEVFDLTAEWTDYEFTLRSCADGRPLCFCINFGVSATMDLQWLRCEQIPTDDHDLRTVVPLVREEQAVVHHRAMVSEACQKQPAIAFLGDSITDGWDGSEGLDIWNRDLLPLNVVNFGIGANRIEHVLWQVQNMRLGEAFSPRLIVLMIGINNVFRVCSRIDIAEGFTNLLGEIRERSPKSKLLILGLLPQGREPGTARREVITQINTHYASHADGRTVFFRDIGGHFLDPSGHIPPDISADGTHLQRKGYEIWSSAMLPTITALL